MGEPVHFLQFALEQSSISCTIGDDQDDVRGFDSQLQSKTAATNIDEQRVSPTAICGPLDNQAFAIAAADYRDALDER